MPSGQLVAFPQRREDRAVEFRILGDVVVELQDEAVLLEGADPLVGLDEHVRAFADAEDAQELERILVETGGRALVDGHRDALVGAFLLEFGVEPLGRLDDVAGAKRPGGVGARPELEGDGFLGHRRCRKQSRSGQRR